MDLTGNFKKIEERIQQACHRAGRDRAEIALVAVTKGHPPQTVRAAAELGLTLFGENKVQEAKAKIGLCPGNLHWHMIGHLQSNKCRDAVYFFEMIESIDSQELAVEVNEAAEKWGKTMRILLEVNIAAESSKFGFRPEQVLEQLEAINALQRLEIHGLMTIAPWTPEPEKVRPIFRQLRELKEECEQKLGAPLQHLSMGMSGDFEIGIEEGATIVRIGTALFGPRAAARKAGQPA